jgi:hypothetical protein
VYIELIIDLIDGLFVDEYFWVIKVECLVETVGVKKMFSLFDG